MALDLDKLKADATIAAANLDESVLNAIATLSQNDENIVINQKVGATYQLVDNVVAEITGETKPNGMKTTDFVKTHLTTLKTTAEKAGDIDKIVGERDKLKSTVSDLEKQIREGATDKALKGQLEKLQNDLKQKEADIANLSKTKDEEIGKWKSQAEKESTTNLELAYKAQANAYFETLTFDPKLPQWAIDAKKNEVLEMVKREKGVPSWEGEGDNRKLVFRDSNGAVLNNASNGLKPFTFGELAGDYVKDAVTSGGGGGGGTNPPRKQSGGGGGSGFSIAGMKSKTQVINAIKQQLQDDGIAITDEAYQSKFNEMYATEGVDKLPMETPRT